MGELRKSALGAYNLVLFLEIEFAQRTGYKLSIVGDSVGTTIIRRCMVLCVNSGTCAVTTIVTADGKVKKRWWRSGETEIWGYNR